MVKSEMGRGFVLRFFLMVVKIATSWLDSFNRGDAWDKFVCGNHGSVPPNSRDDGGGKCGSAKS